MRKAILTAAIVLLLLPSVSFGATTQELENQRIELMKQLIVLLEARVEHLMTLLGGKSQVLGVATSTVSTANSSATTTEVVKKKKRKGGGGGGGGSSRRNDEPTQVNASLSFELSANNPDESYILVDAATSTGSFTLLGYNIQANDGGVELLTMYVEINSGTAPIDSVVEAVGLTIDGQYFEFNDVVFVNDHVIKLVYNINGAVVIPAGENVEVELYASFYPQDGNYEAGETVQASVSAELADTTVATDGETLTSEEISGSAVGGVHEIILPGIYVPVESIATSSDAQGENDTVGVFTVEFDVLAVDGDYYIRQFASDDESATSGVEYMVENGLDSVYATGTIVAALTSTADEDSSGVFTVREGEIETFTLHVTVAPETSGQYRVALTAINFSENVDGVTDAKLYEPVSVYRTFWQHINSGGEIPTVPDPEPTATTTEPEPAEDDTATSTDEEGEVSIEVSNAVPSFSLPNEEAIEAGYDGVFWLDVDVTAVGADLYIANWITEGNSVGGLEYEFETQSGSGTPLAFTWSTVDTVNDVHKVAEGETVTFTVEVFVNASVSGEFKIGLTGINYTLNPDGLTDIVQFTPTPASDFDTDWRLVNAS